MLQMSQKVGIVVSCLTRMLVSKGGVGKNCVCRASTIPLQSSNGWSTNTGWGNPSSGGFGSFCMLIWGLWRARNLTLHGEVEVSADRILEGEGSLLFEFNKTLLLTEKCTVSQPKTLTQDRWIPPQPGRLRLNTDVAINAEKGMIGLGGVIRDDHRAVLGAFSKSSRGLLDAQLGESLAIRAGLIFAMECGLRINELEFDALNVIHALQG